MVTETRTLADVGAKNIYDSPSGKQRISSDGVADRPDNYTILAEQSKEGHTRYAVLNRHTDCIDVTSWGDPECTHADAICNVSELAAFEG